MKTLTRNGEKSAQQNVVINNVCNGGIAVPQPQQRIASADVDVDDDGDDNDISQSYRLLGTTQFLLDLL